MPTPNYTDQRASTALRVLRLVVCTLIFVHGASRFLTGGVTGFGEFLTGEHIPLGPAIAWAVTIIELLGTIILATGYLVRPLAIYYATELTMGILLVHRHAGWFVVGGGRNGMEYSVLLIAAFLIIAWAAQPGRRDTD